MTERELPGRPGQLFWGIYWSLIIDSRAFTSPMQFHGFAFTQHYHAILGCDDTTGPTVTGY